MKKLFALVICLIVLTSSGFAQQDLQSTLNKLAGQAALGYVDPISQGFLTNLNGGLFHKAPKAKLFGIDLELGLAVMATPFGDLPKDFTAASTFTFNKSQADQIAGQQITGTGALNDSLRKGLSSFFQQQIVNINISGPTVLGKAYSPTDPTSEVKIDINGNFTYHYTHPLTGKDSVKNASVSQTLKTGFGGVGSLGDLSFIPFGAVQASIGTLFGTQVTIRYLPKYTIKDVGDFSWTGFGIQHNLGYWLPIPFVDLAASFFTQTIKIDPIFEMKGTAFGLNASKQFGFAFLNVTPYAGFMLENSKMTVNIQPAAADYGPGVTPPNVNFEITGNNSSRITLGLSLRILIININADYNIGKYNSMTGGVFFAF